MEFIGRQIEFGVATEAVRGTAETVADKWVRKAEANVVERAVHAVDESTHGKLEAGEGRRVVQKYAEGDVSGIVFVDMLGWFLSNIYGKVTTTNVAGSVYSHVFNLQQSIQHQSLTLFMKDGDTQQVTLANAMLNTLQLAFTQDDYVRYTASFIAGVAADNTDTPSDDTEYDFIARDITVKIAATEAALGAADAIKVKTGDITFDKGVIRDHVVGSRNPDDLYNSQMMIEGNIMLNFTDETYKDLFLGDTAKYMQISIVGEADLGGSNYPTITILLNNVQFMDWNRAGGSNDLVTQDVKFRAFYNATDGKQSQTTLQNLTTAYTNVPSN